MKKSNKVQNESNFRQYSMQELQINTFSELAKTFNEQMKRIFKHFVK